MLPPHLVPSESTTTTMDNSTAARPAGNNQLDQTRNDKTNKCRRRLRSPSNERLYRALLGLLCISMDLNFPSRLARQTTRRRRESHSIRLISLTGFSRSPLLAYLPGGRIYNLLAGCSRYGGGDTGDKLIGAW